MQLARTNHFEEILERLRLVAYVSSRACLYTCIANEWLYFQARALCKLTSFCKRSRHIQDSSVEERPKPWIWLCDCLAKGPILSLRVRAA